eukprot:jgi/Botrbrau1/3571/Bobra.0078s0028.2
MDIRTDTNGNVVVDRRTVEGFENRVNATFGNLPVEFTKTVGGVEVSGSVPAWCLRTNVVFNSGKDAAYSSDEEEEAAAHEQMRNEQLPGTELDLEEDDMDNLVKPSLAFCKALDNEEEYDQIDEMASRSLGGYPRQDTLPDRRMEVLDDNVYDQRAQQHADAASHRREAAEEAAGQADATPMEVEQEQGPVFPLPSQPRKPRVPEVPDGDQSMGTLEHSASGYLEDRSADSAEAPGFNTRGRGGGALELVGGAVPDRWKVGASAGSLDTMGPQGTGDPSRTAGRHGGSEIEPAEPLTEGMRTQEGLVEGEKPRKRVRFKDTVEPWVPPHRRVTATPVTREDAGTGPSRAVEKRSGPPSGGGRSQGARQGRSRVPDHVLHPERYTMYTLDEPLVVGGGGGGHQSAADLFKTAEAAQEAAGQQSRAVEMETEEAARDLPAFGSGIQFRPKPKPSSGMEESGRAAAAPGGVPKDSHGPHGGAPKDSDGPRISGLAHLEEYMTGSTSEQDMEEEAGDSEAVGTKESSEQSLRPAAGIEPVSFSSKQRQRRNLRNRSATSPEGF